MTETLIQFTIVAPQRRMKRGTLYKGKCMIVSESLLVKRSSFSEGYFHMVRAQKYSDKFLSSEISGYSALFK